MRKIRSLSTFHRSLTRVARCLQGRHKGLLRQRLQPTNAFTMLRHCQEALQLQFRRVIKQAKMMVNQKDQIQPSHPIIQIFVLVHVELWSKSAKEKDKSQSLSTRMRTGARIRAKRFANSKEMTTMDKVRDKSLKSVPNPVKIAHHFYLSSDSKKTFMKFQVILTSDSIPRLARFLWPTSWKVQALFI